jgi:hypothetical protein
VFEILLHGYQRTFDQSLSKSKDLVVMLRFLPGVVVQKRMSIQGMVELYRIEPDLLERLIKFTIDPINPSSSHYILDYYLSRFLQDRDVLSSITAIPCFNIFLFAVIFYFYWIDPLLLGGFSHNLSSHFLNFDILVITLLIMFALTSITIYVQPPGFFSKHGTFPTTTLL